MSSRGHDFILELIHMKMKELGYVIVSSDNHYTTLKFKRPATIINHKPDAIGYNKFTDSICIGEAKYYGDLNSKRSETQIIDFLKLALELDSKIKVIFGIPDSEEPNFRSILNKHNLKLNGNVILLKSPDSLIPGNKYERDQL